MLLLEYKPILDSSTNIHFKRNVFIDPSLSMTHRTLVLRNKTISMTHRTTTPNQQSNEQEYC